MRLRRSLQKSITAMMIAITSASTWSLATSAQAQSSKDEHKLTLRAIMQELGAEYLRLANAIVMDDFAGIEQSARAIQSHPLPDAIVLAIKNRLGGKFAAFEHADEASHQSAADLIKSAAAKEIQSAAPGRLPGLRMAASAVINNSARRSDLSPTDTVRL